MGRLHVTASEALQVAMVGAITLAASFGFGFVFAGFHNPIALASVAVAAMAAWLSRAWIAEHRVAALLGAALLVVAAALFLISPTYIGSMFR